MKNTLYVYTDGGSRGNPGPSAIGVYIKGESKEFLSYGETIGTATNNIAEYKAILFAISWLCRNIKIKENIEQIYFYMDSELAYSQLVGLYKVKNANIRNLVFEIRQKEAELRIPIFYKHIPREQNKKADALVNKALNAAYEAKNFNL